MKKLSRVFAMLLIIMMLATMAVSCKKKDADDEEDEVAGVVNDEESNTEGEDKDNDKESEDGKKEEDDKQEGANADEKEDSKENQNKEDEKITGSTEVEGEQHGEGAGQYKETEDGTITETGNHEVNEDFVIQGSVTNDNGFIPDDEQGLEKSEREATEKSKYDFDRNPLINRDRQVNKQALPSFAIDDTGFVRDGTTIKDLKGKTLQFFTADNFPGWSYRNEKGETIDEWQWFKDLKREVGLSIKYEVKQHQKSTAAALQYMNAGKQCDVVYANHVIYPNVLCISRSITDLIAINNLGSSPGVCKNTMDVCRWGNTLRVVAPIGVVDVLWYNQTLTQELALSDPHTMWEKGAWSWDTFKKYMLSAPKTTKDGKELVAFVEWGSNCSYVWPSTNGKESVKIDATAPKPTLINNWLAPEVLATWEFICGVKQQINFKCTPESETSAGNQKEHVGMYEGTTLMSATMYTQVYRDTEYSKHVQINWVPFPKANTPTGQEVCQYYGFGMVLPRKTSNEKNVNYALKFMELWATRFTETYFDNLNTFEYYNFNYKQRKQYFDFVTQHVVFSPSFAGRPYYTSEVGGNILEALGGNAAYNIKTEMQQVANKQAQVVAEMMKYGN